MIIFYCSLPAFQDPVFVQSIICVSPLQSQYLCGVLCVLCVLRVLRVLRVLCILYCAHCTVCTACTACTVCTVLCVLHFVYCVYCVYCAYSCVLSMLSCVLCFLFDVWVRCVRSSVVCVPVLSIFTDFGCALWLVRCMCVCSLWCVYVRVCTVICIDSVCCGVLWMWRVWMWACCVHVCACVLVFVHVSMNVCELTWGESQYLSTLPTVLATDKWQTRLRSVYQAHSLAIDDRWVLLERFRGSLTLVE